MPTHYRAVHAYADDDQTLVIEEIDATAHGDIPRRELALIRPRPKPGTIELGPWLDVSGWWTEGVGRP